MKKLIALVFVVSMLAAVGCGKPETKPASQAGTSPTATTPASPK